MTKEITLEIATQIYDVIKDAVAFHRAIGNGLADALVWDNIVPTKEGGARCLKALLEKGDYSTGEIAEVNDHLSYWNENYEALRTQVFYRDDAHISPSEIK